jgi:phospholipid/cholesterol/gamma-HCH transport system substrate-binding protein
VRAEVKPFSERNLFVIGAIGIAVTVAIILGAINYDKLPFFNQGKEYSAYFAEAGGLTNGAAVHVSGFQVGKVESIELDGPKVLMGTKILEGTSRGEGQQEGTIPLDRSTSPYQLPDALGELATTISGLNTDQSSDSLRVLADTFADTPPELKIAVEGVARFSDTLNQRDAQLRGLLANADKATTVLAERSNQVVGLIANTNALLAELENQSAAVDQISGNISPLSQQLQGFIAENRDTMRPALDKLNGVLIIIDNRKERLQKSIKLLDACSMSLGESVSSGPFFKNYIANLLPGQFVQPFVDVAFSDLGWIPTCCCPPKAPTRRSASREPCTACAFPAHRAGRRTASDAARRHHRQPRRSGLRPARLTAARPDWLLPVSRAAARATTGWSATGTSCRAAAGAGVHTAADAEPRDDARAG